MIRRDIMLAAGLMLPLLAVAAPVLDDNAVVRFEPCQRNYETPSDGECARMPVPENPDEPAGRKISLNLMRVPAVNKTARDPLFIVVGGPGGAAVRSARQYLPYFRELQQERDIIFVDQRGTGESNGLKCSFSESQFTRLNDVRRRQQAREQLARCAAQLEGDPRFYTTPYAVWDLEQVRQALGYKQINLWGISYGTRVILAYMRTYPSSVRTAVLDGVAPVSIQLPRFAEEDASRALDLLLRECEQDPACFDTYGNLRGDWLELLASLERQPRELVLFHPRSQEPVPTYLSAITLSGWLRLALYSRELAPVLPQAMQRAVNGDFSALGNIALLAVEDIAEHVSQGMQMAVLCAEDQNFPAVPTNLKVPHQDNLLRLDRPEVFASFCESFPSPDLPDSYFKPVKSNIPTLLLSGKYDPVTPPRWAERVAENLTNSLHLVAPGAHHGVTMHGCAARLVREFIEAGTVTAIDPGCLQAVTPKAFFIDAAGPAMARAKAGQDSD